MVGVCNQCGLPEDLCVCDVIVKEQQKIQVKIEKKKFGKNFEELPTGAMGLYTYNQRLAQGLKQLMCGARKFALQHITRDDIVALTTEAARASGIKYVMDADKEEVEKILS